MRTNFTMQDENIRLVRGDSLSFNIVMYGEIQELDSAYFTIKKDYDSETLVQKSLSNGITVVEEGVYAVRVAPEDTINLDIGRYYYDLQVGCENDVMTILRGILNLVYDVTKEA